MIRSSVSSPPRRRAAAALTGLIAAAALAAPSAAPASGGLAACAAGFGVGAGGLAPVTTALGAPPPGPVAGPASRVPWTGTGLPGAKNNGTYTVALCGLRAAR
jgi:hypothetical protein